MLGLLKLANFMEAVPKTLGRWVSWLILPLVFIIVFDVVSRKIPGLQPAINDSFLYDYVSATKLQEWEWHLHTVLFLIALGYTYTMNGHVRVDLIREKLTDLPQAWIEFIGIPLLLLPYCVVMGLFSWDFTIMAYTEGEGSAALTGLPHRFLIKAFLIIGLFLAAVAGLSVWLKHFVYLFGPKHLRSEIRMNTLSSAATDGLPRIDDDVAGETAEQKAG